MKLYESQRDALPPLPAPETAVSAHLAKTVVVVIGESASRDHWSLYGYALPTTPRIDAFRDSIYVFSNAIGSSAATSGNMERILTFKVDDATEGDSFRYPRLIDLFKHAGYRTFWLSNQERRGVVSNISGIYASDADDVRYLGRDNSSDALFCKYDEVLLPAFRSAVADTSSNKLIFLHLLGSHTEYSERYPAECEAFDVFDELSLPGRPWLTDDEAAVVAAYDNSVHYTDSILGVILEEVKALDESAVLVHFSDHGEGVYDDGFFNGRGARYVRVPFFIYLNDSYRHGNPDLVRAVESACGRPFSTANLIFSLMTLTGSSYQAYDSTYDVLSNHFIARQRYVDEQVWEYDITK